MSKIKKMYVKVLNKTNPEQEYSMHYGKVKSTSHYDVAHMQPLINVPTKYQLLMSYHFRDIARTKF